MVKQTVTITRNIVEPTKSVIDFVNMVEGFESEISFCVGDGIYSAKSIISMIAGDFLHNREVEFICNGSDEQEAMEGITEWLMGDQH